MLSPASPRYGAKLWKCKAWFSRQIIHIPMTQKGASHVLLRENIIMVRDGFADVSFYNGAAFNRRLTGV
jgi:hypothetical protein